MSCSHAPADRGLQPLSAARRRRLAAAYFQHQVARAAYAELGSGRRYDLDSLAEQLGESRDYVRRKLHGRIPMAFDDLMRLVELLGVQILPPLDPANFDDLLPS